MILPGALRLIRQTCSLPSWSLQSSRGKDVDQTFVYSLLQLLRSRNVFPFINVEMWSILLNIAVPLSEEGEFHTQFFLDINFDILPLATESLLPLTLWLAL